MVCWARHLRRFSGQGVSGSQALSEIPSVSSLSSAYDYLQDFGDRALVIASACRTAAEKLQLPNGIGGRPRQHWHDEFTAILLGICEQNGLEPTAGLDRTTGKPVGDVYEFAVAFERLLWPEMRARTPQALVKRLQRSLRQLDGRSRIPNPPDRTGSKTHS